MNKLFYTVISLSASGAFLGAREVYSKSSTRYFSNNNDNLERGCARGICKMYFLIFNTVKVASPIFLEEYKKSK